MGLRIALQQAFETILGSRNVYFQAPATFQMKYPCIRYSRDNDDEKKADNNLYSFTRCYNVVVIDPNPDSTIAENILKAFPMCRIDRHYTADNLNHTVLTLYY